MPYSEPVPAGAYRQTLRPALPPSKRIPSGKARAEARRAPPTLDDETDGSRNSATLPACQEGFAPRPLRFEAR